MDQEAVPAILALYKKFAARNERNWGSGLPVVEFSIIYCGCDGGVPDSPLLADSPIKLFNGLHCATFSRGER